MLTCFNVQKTHFSNAVHYCRSSMPRLKRFVFYKVPPSDKHSLLWLANWPSVLWLAEHHKPHRKCNSPFHHPAFKIKVKTVNNVLSFTISSSLRGEQSRVTEVVKKLVCVCTQAAVVWPCLPLSHTHTIAVVQWCDLLSHTTRKTPHLNSQQQIPIFKYW